MTDRLRATDPGLKLGQIGRVTWVHCPECDHAARLDGHGVACRQCGYMTIQKTDPYSDRWARLRNEKQLCVECRHPLPDEVRPTAERIGDKLHTRVKCPHCQEVADYPAYPASPPTTAGSKESRLLPLYLTTQVAGRTLWVDNLAHLDLLDQWLGASLRERGPVRGKTMLARLPRWMKVSTARPKILRGLRQLRERARRAGIDE